MGTRRKTGFATVASLEYCKQQETAGQVARWVVRHRTWGAEREDGIFLPHFPPSETGHVTGKRGFRRVSVGVGGRWKGGGVSSFKRLENKQEPVPRFGLWSLQVFGILSGFHVLCSCVCSGQSTHTQPRHASVHGDRAELHFSAADVRKAASQRLWFFCRRFPPELASLHSLVLSWRVGLLGVRDCLKLRLAWSLHTLTAELPHCRPFSSAPERNLLHLPGAVFFFQLPFFL